MSNTSETAALLHRLAETQRERISFTLDGEAMDALLGDTVLTAVLTHRAKLRHSEFSGEARAGFCLMGACQDCWVRSESGERYQSCCTFVEPGMRLLTQAHATP